MPSRTAAYLYVHLAGLLFGGTALCAKLIDLPAAHITFWRSIIAVGGLLILQHFRRKPVLLERRQDYLVQLGLGLVFGLHWWAYYEGIQRSTVAIGVTALFTAPVMTVFLEPLLYEGRVKTIDVLLGGVVLVGVWFLTPEFDLRNEYTVGVAFGICSALGLSLRNILHRRFRRDYGALQLLIYQVIGICVVFAAVPVLSPQPMPANTVAWLFLLGLVFTAIPHGCIVTGLHRLPARTVLLVSSLMVVYGSGFAWLFLAEIPTLDTFIGAALIMSAATIETVRRK